MSFTPAVRELMRLYPRIFFACHVRHVPDPATRQTLTAHQASILDHLDEEPTNLLRLARHMGVTPSTMSLTVDRLVQRGDVLREQDPADRRRVRLQLTPAGVRIKNTQRVLEPELVEAMLRRLSPAELTDALRGLELLARAADEVAQERGETRFGPGRGATAGRPVKGE